MHQVPKTFCMRCYGTMESIGIEKIQLGQTGLLLGIWNNIFAGSMLVEIYVCSECGKVEFYTEAGDDSQKLPQKNCPKCERKHDFDYPKCPFCKYSYFD